MKIRRLYIGDFGILRNQTLEDLQPGLVVIGGLNRAGKSTFMEALRHLGYGFSKSSTLPPPNGQGYEIDADLMLDDNMVYNLRIQGYGEPVLTKISAQNNDLLSSRDLYVVDEFTYRQLFTISLRQLDKIPREISGKDIERLQSMLLGAGFTELIKLPVLENEMIKEADKIGGKRGNPSVKLFKPYYNQIQEGSRLKKKALEQVEIYQNKRAEISNIAGLITQTREEIDKLQRLGVQLDTIRANFNIYKHKKELEFKMSLHPGKSISSDFPINIMEKVKALQANYEELAGQCFQHTARFKEALGGFVPIDVKEKLLERKSDIEKWITAISGIREQIRQYFELDKEYKRKKSDLITRMQSLNGKWREEDLKSISTLPVDRIEEIEFLELMERYKALKEERRNLSQSINEMEENEKQLIHRLGKLKTTSLSSGMKKYLYGAVIFVLAGVFSSFLDWGIGVPLSVAGIIGMGLYLFVKMSSGNGYNIRRQEMEAQLDGILTRIDAAVERNKSLEQEWRVLDAAISEYRRSLGLGSDISPDVLKEHFHTIRNIRERFLEVNNFETQMSQLKNWLRLRLRDLADLLRELDGKAFQKETPDDESLIPQSEYIFTTLKKWHELLGEVLILKGKEQELKAMEDQIRQLIDIWKPEGSEGKTFDETLNTFIDTSEMMTEYLKMQQERDILNKQILHSLSMERIKNAIIEDSTSAIEGDYTEADIVKEFEKMCQKYGTADEVEEEWRHNKERLEKEMDQLEELKESHVRLQDELQGLSTMENLQKAQMQIDKGRSELRPMAYQYAVYTAAAFIIGKVRQNLLDGVKDMVLDKAARIFEKMTSGDYVGILPPENWIEPDFKAMMEGGTVQESADILSQGTREQLYLAVRISRILDIQPSLPVILDDCMANFDCRHVKESLKILGELAQTHQVFMLTCHPELVEAAANCVPNAQYWVLDRGRFAITSSAELISHLM